MKHSMRLATPLFLLVTASSAALAQQARNDNAIVPAAPAAEIVAAPVADHPAAATRSAGPTVSNAAVGVRAERATAPAVAPSPAPRRAETNQNKAMMIVGAAGLIVGAIIGDTAGTLIMVAGAGVGLYGLYKYLE